jgi:hypothetical protein
MTTVTESSEPDIIDAEVMSRAAVLRDRATQAAKTGAAVSGRAAARGSATLARRYWRGIITARRSFLDYWNDIPGGNDIDECEPGKRESAKASHEKKKIRNRATVLSFALSGVSWCTGGLLELHRVIPGWPGIALVALLYLVVVTLPPLVSVAVWGKRHQHGWLWPIVLWVLFAATLVSLLVHVGGHVATGWMDAGAAVVASVWFLVKADDGDLFGDAAALTVQRLDEPSTREASEPNAVRAIAKGLAVKDEEAASEVAIVGTPSRDARGVWTRTHFQLQTRTFSELERTGTPSPMQKVAAALRRPSSWVFVERVGDESQGLLYVADSNPWPTEPIPWRGLTQLEHDAWAPSEIGVDMLTGQPVSIAPAATSDMCGASPGGGKTAWSRREMCLLAADPFVDRVIWDLKGDGALAMFEPTCSRYADGDDEQTMREFADWLAWFRDEESARRKTILGELTRAGLCPDVKLTREIARNPEYGIPLMVVVVDEAQEGCSHKRYGKDISDGLTYIAKQGRSLGVRLKIRTQKPTDDRTGIPSPLNSVLPTRIAGRAEDYQVSKATLLTSKLRADQMPEDVEGLFYLRLPGNRYEKVIAEYVDANQAADYVRRVRDYQRGAGLATPAPAAEPVAAREVPRVLVELRRLLSDRDGRMTSVEVAAALRAYGIVEVTPDDRAGAKTDDQIAQEKVAALVKPFGVYARPDRANGNRATYWLAKEHRELGEVGVLAAIARLESGRPVGLHRGSGRPSHGGSGRASAGVPEGVPGRPSLHVV